MLSVQGPERGFAPSWHIWKGTKGDEYDHTGFSTARYSPVRVPQGGLEPSVVGRGMDSAIFVMDIEL
jgi:hypothetical protein